MDDAKIADLRIKRDVIKAELSQIEGVLADYERVAARINALLSASAEGAITHDTAPVAAETQPSPVDNSETVRRRRGPKGSSPEAIADAATAIIKQHGRPMTRFALIEPLEAQGFKIGGFDKPRNLGTILWRSGRFENTGEGYWPKREPDDARPVQTLGTGFGEAVPFAATLSRA
ncbi:MAG: hypothetical protein ABIT04_03710 [Novosphingobium sp.]